MNNREIERKFLVLNENFQKKAVKSSKIIQGYLSKDPERTVRIRIKDDKGFITVKGIADKSGASRFEFEKEINKQDALQTAELCLPEIITKTRYYIPSGKHTYEVDVFDGKNKGLILAEIELNNENETFLKPDWLGEEVTGDKRYYNSYLSEFPFSTRNSEKIQTNIIAELTKKMINCFGKDVKRINHALKVFAYAKTIAELEKVHSSSKQIIEISTLLHDIGIKVCEKKYGSTAGKYQEIESSIIAKQILSDFEIPENTLKRILFIISNHHSYNKIDGIDFQILAEADFLVNFEEGNEAKNHIPTVRKTVFKTETGILFLDGIF